MTPSPIPADPYLKVELSEATAKGLSVALVGSISHDTSVGLLQELLELQQKAAASLMTLEMGRVEFVDSQGIGVICGLHAELEKRGSCLKLNDVTPAVKRLLSLMRLDKLLKLD